jgi:homoserine kinase type II
VSPLDTWARQVLDCYPPVLSGSLDFLGNHGGFSGSRLWRLETLAGSYCLKAWPADWRSRQDLAWIHSQLDRAGSLPYIPHIVPTRNGSTFVEHEGRLWELATWMPGQADFAHNPSRVRLQSACTALARLHECWPVTRSGVCPAIERRWDSWQTWHGLVHKGWRPTWSSPDPWTQAAEELWCHVESRIDSVLKLLAPWLVRSVTIQPCVCDLWHDHVLYSGDAVTGLIDFGSAREDHIAVDLARLLGSLVGDDAVMWDAGLSAYRAVRPLAAEEQALAHDLDRTGTILAATHWLRWLYHEGRRYEQPAAVVNRLTELLRRLQRDTFSP